MPEETVRGAPQEDVSRIRRVTWTGLICNIALSALKLAGGLLGHSQVVVADAVHSLSDSTTDIAVLVGVRYWSRPPDGEHPHGHGRIEALVTLLIGLMLAAAAVGLGWRALATLPQAHASPPGLIALAAALVSIVSKEILYRWTVAVGRRTGSNAVVANAWHHRSDALSSIPAALAVLAARMHPAWYFVDHVGAVVVSVFILRSAVQVAWPALQELMDTGVSREEQERIRQIALDTDGVREVHGLRTRIVGNTVHADLHILVDGDMAVRRGHEVSERVKQRLLDQGPRLADVVVHLEPYED
ncbi:MAG: cation diffusion facilitator family transporter [Candidatus Brocadiia bacterium]